jgi:hypothetical protein
MSLVHGKEGKVKFSSNAVASIARIRLNVQVAADDTTAMGDEWQDHVTGIPGWSGEVECRHDPADSTGQDAAEVGTEVTIGFYTQGDGSGKQYRTGTATIISEAIEGNFNGVPSFTFGVQGKGALTKATV